MDSIHYHPVTILQTDLKWEEEDALETLCRNIFNLLFELVQPLLKLLHTTCPFNPSFIRQALPTGLRGHFSVLSYSFGICLLRARMKYVHFTESDFSQRIAITFSDFSSSSPELIFYVSILINCAPSLCMQESWSGVVLGLNLKHIAFSRFWESGYSKALVSIAKSWAEFMLLAAAQ